MTRLSSNDISGIGHQIKSYDAELFLKTGLTLTGIACFAAGITEKQFEQETLRNTVFVVPVTAGKGVIQGFTGAVKSIVEYMGFQASITCDSDVSGLAEAVRGGAGIVFMADDQKFVALNCINRTVVDNAEATARGYISALNAMGRGLKGREVLVIGAGRVGSVAIACLNELGANVSLFDLDYKKLQSWKHSGINIERNLFRALPKFRYIVEASPEPDFIELEHLHPGASVAAPGIPLGLTGRAYEAVKDRLIHDPLQLGVAVMLAMAVRQNPFSTVSTA